MQAGVSTVEGLLACNERELIRLPNLGRKTLASIVDCLSKADLALSRVDQELLKPAQEQPRAVRTTRHASFWSHTYILLSASGETYLGATTNLRSRLRAHNSNKNTGWTKGRKWHILGVRRFESRNDAFSYERELKMYPHRKIIWKLQCVERACKIAARHGYQFDPSDWLLSHHPSYVKAARRQNEEK
jgi:predicted GIY-YIG superfamily endonuclease